MKADLKIKTDSVRFNGESFASESSPALARFLDTLWKSDMFIIAGPPSVDPYYDRLSAICNFVQGEIVSYDSGIKKDIKEGDDIIR